MTETEREWGRGRQRGEGETQQAPGLNRAPGSKLSVQSPTQGSKNQPLNRLSHPGTPMPPIPTDPIKGSLELALNLLIPHIWEANSMIT